MRRKNIHRGFPIPSVHAVYSGGGFRVMVHSKPAARTWMLCSTAMSESHAHVTVRDWFEKLPRRHPHSLTTTTVEMMAFGSRALSVG